MAFDAPEFLPALPEMFLLAIASLGLLADAFFPERYRAFTYQFAQAGLVTTAVLVLVTYPGEPQITFSQTFINDGMGAVLKLFVLLVTYVVFFYSKDYLRERNLFTGEYFILGLFAVLGMMVLVSARSLLTIYLGLELLSLSLYVLVAIHRDSLMASEAAMKYFVLGALASGMLLYGMSMLYGITGSLDLEEVSEFVAGQSEPNLVSVLGLVFIVVAIAFKLGAVPFHMWVPDVYEGAPTSVTLFLGTAPKLAAFAMLMRLLVDGLGGLQGDWTQMLVPLAVLSLAVGNVVAIAQTNLKRMLAYSTIAHVGFLFLGIIAGSPAGYAASMFYIIAYSLMAMGAFGMIIVLSRAGFESDALEDFKGLNDRSSWLAFLMLVLMLSMAGVPPFLGFWAKWSVLLEIVNSGMVWLAVLAVLFSVVGLYYYLRLVRLMYFDRSEAMERITAGFSLRVMMSTNALAILALGIYPSGLMTLCVSVLVP
ncbi:MAG: NADH-quinone oxidoreductase subunit NuoN [Gammaproteobacteria bacterium]